MARTAAKTIEPETAETGGTSPEGTISPVDQPKRLATRVQASVLLGALKDVAGIVQGRNVIPILDHVLIEAANGTITLTASDLDVWATRDCASADRDGPGSAEWLAGIQPFGVTLPAKALQAVLAELDGDAMVTLERESDDGGRVTVKAGRARFKLLSLPPGDFPMPPRFPAASTFEMPCSQLADAFAAVEHAISTEETRYYLNGVYLHPHEDPGSESGAGWTLRLATTDGHRLARLTLPAPDGALTLPASIVATRTIALLDKLLAASAKASPEGGTPHRVLIEADESRHETGAASRLRFSMAAADGGEITVVAKTIDGTYPDYARVIPSEIRQDATLGRSSLISALKRVMVLAPKDSRCVKAEFDEDRLTLSVTSAKLGEAREELPCSFAGEPLTIGFNGAFWRQALEALATDDVVMGFTDAGGPALLRGQGGDPGSGSGAGEDPERFVQVLMPMRV